MQALYAQELGTNDPDDIIKRLWEEGNSSPGIREFSSFLIKRVIENKSVLDSVIKKYAIEWNLERIAAVDRNILRIAIYELIYSSNVPGPVAVNEAIEMAKSYGGDESPRFINGILGNVIKELPEIKNNMSNEIQ
jgi:N utilization substance protein B